MPGPIHLKTRQDEIDYVKYLAHVMYTEPNAKYCWHSIRNVCLSRPIHISEAGKRLNQDFTETIHGHFVKFAADAIAMHYMCGFVAYYIETRNGIRLPFTLPLGAFTWSFERMQREDRVWPFYVKIRGIECSFDERRVHIFTHNIPSRNVLYSPMDNVVRLLKNYTTIHDSITSTLRNSDKVNILISEKIDIKDQTLNGIQMLDDARQYMVKGSTPLQQYELGVRLAGTRTDTVNLEREYAMQQTNEKQHQIELTSIPPNSQVTAVAMNSPQTDILKETYTQYVSACHAYFGVAAPASAGPGSDADGSAPASAEATNNVAFVCQMLQELLQEVYAACFRVEVQQVHVKIPPPQILQVKQVADIKTLFECGVFTPQELKRLFS
jgi:hypothetical protein